MKFVRKQKKTQLEKFVCCEQLSTILHTPSHAACTGRQHHGVCGGGVRPCCHAAMTIEGMNQLCCSPKETPLTSEQIVRILWHTKAILHRSCGERLATVQRSESSDRSRNVWTRASVSVSSGRSAMSNEGATSSPPRPGKKGKRAKSTWSRRSDSKTTSQRIFVRAAFLPLLLLWQCRIRTMKGNGAAAAFVLLLAGLWAAECARPMSDGDPAFLEKGKKKHTRKGITFTSPTGLFIQVGVAL